MSFLERAQRVAAYAQFRERHPILPASLAFEFARGDAADAQSEAAFICERTTGHRWAYTGAAYGGDDESYHGEGRCYCARCGADGDA